MGSRRIASDPHRGSHWGAIQAIAAVIAAAISIVAAVNAARHADTGRIIRVEDQVYQNVIDLNRMRQRIDAIPSRR